MNDQPPSADVRETLRRAYAAFNARDIEVVLSLMHQDVEWPNGMEDGYVYGNEGVRVLDAPVGPHRPDCRTLSLRYRAGRTYRCRASSARARAARQYALGRARAARL